MFGSRPRSLVAVGCTILIGAALLGANASSAAPNRLVHKVRKGDFRKAWQRSVHRIIGPQAPARPSGNGIFQLGSSTERVSNAPAITIARPAGMPGDLMLAVVTARLSPSGTISAPPGWTVVRRDSNVGGTALSQLLSYKLMTTLEPGSYTWRFSASVGATGGISTFANVDPVMPLNADAGVYSANTRLIAAPSLTTDVDGSLVIGLFGNSAKGSMAPPAGMVEDFDVTNSSNNASTSESASYVQATHGPTGYKVARASNNAKSAIGQSVALAPAFGPAPPPPPPPPPPQSSCTRTLAAGGDLSSFLSTLRSGDVGCLRGGEYTDGCEVSWSLNANPGATLTSYPGEQATLHTSLGLAGDNLTASHLRITGIDPACGSSMSGFTVQGANDTIEFSTVYDVPRHGILTNTSSSNVTIHGNLIQLTGSTCNLDHGIYFQTSGQIIRNVFMDMRCGYGIHLYAHPHDVLVAENTLVGSHVRAGIVVQSDGSNITVVNNVAANNATYGIYFQACGSNCLVDHNITWGNAQGGVGGTLAGQVTNNRNVDPQFVDGLYHVAPSSPAVDTARPDFVWYPDRDGVPNGRGAGADLGAYER